MTSTRSTVLDRLTALADPIRSRVLVVLDRYELTVSELCAVLQLPQSTVSRHLKVLADDGWIVSRGEGTSRFYRMLVNKLDPEAGELWQVVRSRVAASVNSAQDELRAKSVLAKRVRIFFSNSAGIWDEMRRQMIGERADLLALLELLDDRWVVGDLGCGTGQISAALAPCVAKVIAVDESGPMLTAAEERLKGYDNVELRTGTIQALPIEDEVLDAAILFLVAHFITDPAKVMREVSRVLKPDGRLLIVDLMSHDRVDYAVQLGHVWQGFDGDQVKDWLAAAGFRHCRYRPLTADPEATGPTLFVASAKKPHQLHAE